MRLSYSNTIVLNVDTINAIIDFTIQTEYKRTQYGEEPEVGQGPEVG